MPGRNRARTALHTYLVSVIRTNLWKVRSWLADWRKLYEEVKCLPPRHSRHRKLRQRRHPTLTEDMSSKRITWRDRVRRKPGATASLNALFTFHNVQCFQFLTFVLKPESDQVHSIPLARAIKLLMPVSLAFLRLFVCRGIGGPMNQVKINTTWMSSETQKWLVRFPSRKLIYSFVIPLIRQ